MATVRGQQERGVGWLSDSHGSEMTSKHFLHVPAMGILLLLLKIQKYLLYRDIALVNFKISLSSSLHSIYHLIFTAVRETAKYFGKNGCRVKPLWASILAFPPLADPQSSRLSEENSISLLNN